jgi:hypothetical protein
LSPQVGPAQAGKTGRGERKERGRAGWLDLGQQAENEQGRRENNFLFFFSKLVFQIHFQKIFESF